MPRSEAARQQPSRSGAGGRARARGRLLAGGQASPRPTPTPASLPHTSSPPSPLFTNTAHHGSRRSQQQQQEARGGGRSLSPARPAFVRPRLHPPLPICRLARFNTALPSEPTELAKLGRSTRAAIRHPCRAGLTSPSSFFPWASRLLNRSTGSRKQRRAGRASSRGTSSPPPLDLYCSWARMIDEGADEFIETGGAASEPDPEDGELRPPGHLAISPFSRHLDGGTPACGILREGRDLLAS